jgi:hypothetical protein
VRLRSPQLLILVKPTAEAALQQRYESPMRNVSLDSRFTLLKITVPYCLLTFVQVNQRKRGVTVGDSAGTCLLDRRIGEPLTICSTSGAKKRSQPMHPCDLHLHDARFSVTPSGAAGQALSSEGGVTVAQRSEILSPSKRQSTKP